MEARIGVESRSKLIHSMTATATNVHDSQVLGDLLHGEETRVWCDSACSGQKDVLRKYTPMAKDFTQKKGSRDCMLSADERARNRTKSRMRAKVEHALHVMKRQFGHTKVRYRGQDKNAHHLFIKCALVSLVLTKRRLLQLSQAQCA